MARLTPEAEYFRETGKVSLLWLTAGEKVKPLPQPRVLDLRPSVAGPAKTAAKRVSILGPTVPEDQREGFGLQETQHDESRRSIFGRVEKYRIDGVDYAAPASEAKRVFPDEGEQEERRRSGMIVGRNPASIIRVL